MTNIDTIQQAQKSRTHDTNAERQASHNKRMQSDHFTRYASETAADAWRYAMRSSIASLLICFSSATSADPHYVQALDPFFDPEDVFSEMLDKSEGPVAVQINKYKGSNDPDVGYDIYIYIYVIKAEGGQYYSLNIGCPGINRKGNKHYSLSGVDVPESSEIALIRHPYFRPRSEKFRVEISNNQIVWALDPDIKRMAVWLYSRAAPLSREFNLIRQAPDGTSSTVNGIIKGPSCESFEE